MAAKGREKYEKTVGRPKESLSIIDNDLQPEPKHNTREEIAAILKTKILEMTTTKMLTELPQVPDRGWSESTIDVFSDCCRDLLRRGRLWPVTLHLVTIYCDSHEIYETATRQITEDARNLTKQDRDTTRKSALFGIRKTAVDEMKNYERKLGFSPYYADRIQDDQPDDKPDPFDF